jgi:hypothetical protein
MIGSGSKRFERFELLSEVETHWFRCGRLCREISLASRRIETAESGFKLSLRPYFERKDVLAGAQNRLLEQLNCFVCLSGA